MNTPFPDLRRLRYFHGQLLTAKNFRDEQDYFVDKLRLRNRCLHGWGVACGLAVTTPHDAAGGQPVRPRVRVEPGVAVDRQGNEIVVPRACEIDLLRRLSPVDREAFSDGDDLHVSVAYCRRPVDPTRRIQTDGCDGNGDTDYGAWLDTYEVLVTRKAPETRGCADLCCADLDEDGRVLLATVPGVTDGAAVGRDTIRLYVRRPLSRYRMTTITGLNWVHGGRYGRDEAAALLGTDGAGPGLALRFSAPVRTSSLEGGVFELKVVQGGRDQQVEAWYPRVHVERPAAPLTDRITFRHSGDQTLQRGDRVIITIRTPFILDRCCRPVDGVHVGGKVPLLPGVKHPVEADDHCRRPPSGTGRWETGTGTGAGNFESWFYVQGEKK